MSDAVTVSFFYRKYIRKASCLNQEVWTDEAKYINRDPRECTRAGAYCKETKRPKK